jgi:hypothetical protein
MVSGDGTLCEGAQSPETVYRGASEAAGVEPFGEPDELWAALEGPPAVDNEVGYLAAGFTRVAAQHGRTPVDAEALASGFLETVDYAAVTPRAGAAAAVEAARRRAAVGLVTNGPESRQAGKLDALPFGDAFGTVVFAGDLRRRKPHPSRSSARSPTSGSTPRTRCSSATPWSTTSRAPRPPGSRRRGTRATATTTPSRTGRTTSSGRSPNSGRCWGGDLRGRDRPVGAPRANRRGGGRVPPRPARDAAVTGPRGAD